MQDIVDTGLPPERSERSNATVSDEIDMKNSLASDTECQDAKPNMVDGAGSCLVTQRGGEMISKSMTSDDLGFYDLFLRRFRQMAEDGVFLTVDEIAERLPDVEKSQVRRWLKRGESENTIGKATKPARYGLTGRRLL